MALIIRLLFYHCFVGMPGRYGRMLYESRPHLHALVAFYSPPFGFLSEPRVMPLEDAADYARFGFIVLVDPADERELAMWEILDRSLKPPSTRKWFEADS